MQTVVVHLEDFNTGDETIWKVPNVGGISITGIQRGYTKFIGFDDGEVHIQATFSTVTLETSFFPAGEGNLIRVSQRLN